MQYHFAPSLVTSQDRAPPVEPPAAHLAAVAFARASDLRTPPVHPHAAHLTVLIFWSRPSLVASLERAANSEIPFVAFADSLGNFVCFEILFSGQRLRARTPRSGGGRKW